MMAVFELNLKKKPDETELAYIWRIGQAKDSGNTQLTWAELAEVMNKELRDPDEAWTESAYRKKYALIKAAWQDIFSSSYSPTDEDIDTKIHELEKVRVKVRDERNELRRLLREQARRESFTEQIERTIVEHTQAITDFNDTYHNVNSDNDLIIHATDIHAGIKIDNWFNKFDEEILQQRFKKYTAKIVEIQERHNSENAYIILSELISGLIHNSLRIENNQDVIEQFLYITDLLSIWIAELSKHFNNITVCLVPGNHSRLTQSKDDCVSHENMDNLAIPYLKAKLQNYSNIHFNSNEIEHSIAMFNVRGNLVMAEHGDKSSPETVVEKLTMMFGVKPNIVFLGHRHRNGLLTVAGSKVIQSGSMSGIDSYCLDKRISGNPEQMVTVVNANGVECIYDIDLS